mmetsp:Transcript_2333/g.4805  ORF Transcript_2333/g.4805 Transcript_2333/m.4805 type:complete len:259 (-) Transcript_2333:243-1019(-)
MNSISLPHANSVSYITAQIAHPYRVAAIRRARPSSSRMARRCEWTPCRWARVCALRRASRLSPPSCTPSTARLRTSFASTRPTPRWPSPRATTSSSTASSATPRLSRWASCSRRRAAASSLSSASSTRSRRACSTSPPTAPPTTRTASSPQPMSPLCRSTCGRWREASTRACATRSACPSPPRVRACSPSSGCSTSTRPSASPCSSAASSGQSPWLRPSSLSLSTRWSFNCQPPPPPRSPLRPPAVRCVHRASEEPLL